MNVIEAPLLEDVSVRPRTTNVVPGDTLNCACVIRFSATVSTSKQRRLTYEDFRVSL